MKKHLCAILLLAFTALPNGSGLFAAPTAADTQKRLQQAAQLYFEYDLTGSLKKYVELSKETQNKDSFLNAAFIAMELGQPRQAVDIMNAAYKKYPDDHDVTEFMAEAYLADGQYTAAEHLHSLLVEKRERAEFLLINLARAQMGMKEYNLAKYNLKTAVRGKNHLPLSNYLLGLVYEQEKD